VPDKTGASGEPNVTLITGGDGADSAINPNGTVYFTTTTGSGLKYYELFNNAGNLYVKDNIYYPYLVDGKIGSVEYMNRNLPISTAKYLQNKTPGFILVNVSGNEVSFAYHDLSSEYLNVPYDTYTVTKTDVQPAEATVNLLHTNDSHGRIYQVDGNNAGMIGIDKIAAIKNSTENAILVDAGDAIHGLPIVNVNNGLNAIDLMAAAGYSVMAPGNHDFNYGSGRLYELAGISSPNGLDIISSNVFIKGTDQSLLQATKIIETGGVKVGFFGLTTTETPILTGPANVETLEFKAYKEAAEEAINGLLENGAQLIVALAHVSRTDIEALVKALDVKPDVVIEGHDHNSGHIYVDGVLIAGAGQYQENLGMVSVTIGPDGSIINKTANIITKAETIDVEGDAGVRALAETMKASVLDLYSEVVAQSEVHLSSARGDSTTQGVRNSEQPLGNLVADSMRIVGGADIAITNGGGLRADIRIGDLTKGDINAILPFGNVLVIKEATPKALKAILENGLKDAPAPAGWFPQVSGMSVLYDSVKPVGEKVLSITINGTSLDLADDATTYKLATNDFMASGGDGYDILITMDTLAELASMDDALIKYITQNLGGAITADNAKLEGRISVYADADGTDMAAYDKAHDDFCAYYDTDTWTFRKYLFTDYTDESVQEAEKIMAAGGQVHANLLAQYGKLAAGRFDETDNAEIVAEGTDILNGAIADMMAALVIKKAPITAYTVRFLNFFAGVAEDVTVFEGDRIELPTDFSDTIKWGLEWIRPDKDFSGNWLAYVGGVWVPFNDIQDGMITVTSNMTLMPEAVVVIKPGH